MHPFLLSTAVGLICSISADSPSDISFSKFDKMAREGGDLTIVFFGGSLTWGAQATDPQRTSYRAIISRRLEKTYPRSHFTFWDSAIGGTGSPLGVFRIERDVLAHKPDLVFLDFTVNDNPFKEPNTDRLASYEAVVRKIVQAGMPVVQVILPVKEDMLSNAPSRPLDARHKEIGTAYGLAVADAVTYVRNLVVQRKADPDELWDAAPDVTHPGDGGYALYADAVWQEFEKAVNDKAICRIPKAMKYPDLYMSSKRFVLSTITALPKGWSIGKPTRSAIAYDFTPSRWMDTVTIAARTKDVAPEPLNLEVRGQNLMFFGEATMKSGKYRVLIDGKEVKTDDVGLKAPHGNWRYADMIVEGLDPKVTHAVQIIPDLRDDQELRLESLCVAGGDATVVVKKN
jgi:lysophospholipase L1-like esterase